MTESTIGFIRKHYISWKRSRFLPKFATDTKKPCESRASLLWGVLEIRGGERPCFCCVVENRSHLQKEPDILS